MSAPKDGGPAFPSNNAPGECHLGVTTLEPCAGMSLRDYFAAHAPMPHSAWISSATSSRQRTYEQVCAEYAYSYADAMLKARDGQPGGGSQ